jgi:Spy/CpxP family protein refolding chaperone
MRLRWIVGMCCVVLFAMVTVRAEDKPAAEKTEKKSMAKLNMPWSKLSNLSDEQKAQIKQIHTKANDEIKAIKEKEMTDITALLNDEQKTELKAIAEADAASKKTKTAKADAPAEKKE